MKIIEVLIAKSIIFQNTVQKSEYEVNNILKIFSMFYFNFSNFSIKNF